jgi:hypothetical protein
MRQRHKPPVTSKSKAGWLEGQRADLQKVRTSHTTLREELTTLLPLKDRKNKWAILPNHLLRLRLLPLKYHRTRC